MNTKVSVPAIEIHKGGDFHWVGNGFPVRSVFSYSDLGQELSPFLLLDYAAPYKFAAGSERRGVGEHPHKGFETVTIAYQGEIEHRDSSGAGGLIGPGDVQWMTAGSGLVHEEFHSERFVREGGTFEVVQLWVNLPAKNKSAKPGYQTILSNQIPKVQLKEGAGELRVIAGTFGNTKGSARTFTDLNLWDLDLREGKSVELPLKEGHTKALLLLRGKLNIAGSGVGDGELVVAPREATSIRIDALNASKILVLSGEPINEPIVGYGPFVMNSAAEIKAAYAEYQMGGFGRLS